MTNLDGLGLNRESDERSCTPSVVPILAPKPPKFFLHTCSTGIASNRQLSYFFNQAETAAKFQYFPSAIKLKKQLAKANDINSDQQHTVVGWGNKANTQKAKAAAEQLGLPYWRLEDGFIAYLNHSSLDKSRLSLICDQQGIYYDARQSCDLEQDLNNVDSWFDGEFALRAEKLIESIRTLGISKYNLTRSPIPDWLKNLARQKPIVLLIDQTAGDQSISGALADQNSFQQMLYDAIADNPDTNIVIKTHTDVVLGKKQGCFDKSELIDNKVNVLSEDVSLAELFPLVEQVYTVSSQVGFEALIHNKSVHCYGMPFYAGWGLTQDKIQLDRRQKKLNLTQLVAAALIRYPKYLHPDSQQLCQVEDIIDWLELQGVGEKTEQIVNICYAVNFSLWKRSFIPEFIGRRARRVKFVSSFTKAQQLAASQDAILLWGRSLADQVEQNRDSIDAKIWFIEDGFVRSVGLGADLRRPDSLVIDECGMYYDPATTSSIVHILNNQNLSAKEQQRAEQLADQLLALKISKYNVGNKNQAALSLLVTKIEQAHKSKKEIILVPGQFENDLSVRSSWGKVKTNAQLLTAVREDFPQAFIIFKEHPDLYSGVRPGALGEQKALTNADFYLGDVDIAEALVLVDRVATLTSLTGFEALLRGKKVSTYGSPFYAGWGLTDDKVEFNNRKKSLNLSELIDGVLVKYAKYINWQTRKFTSPEFVVEQLYQQKSEQKAAQKSLKSHWFSRQVRKIKYFWHAYKKASF